MILLLNGAFGIGKTTIARKLASAIPDSLLFDPELIGIPLQHLTRLSGHKVDDFQDLALWRRLTIQAIRAARWRASSVIVPMAISNLSYLNGLRSGISRFEPHLLHFCLTAPEDVVHSRLEKRGADRIRDEWQFRRASECCNAHVSDAFAEHVDTSNKLPDEIATILLASFRESVAARR